MSQDETEIGLQLPILAKSLPFFGIIVIQLVLCEIGRRPVLNEYFQLFSNNGSKEEVA